MRRKMGMKKYILRFKARRIVIVAMLLLWAVVFLTQCSKEDAPEATIAISETLTTDTTTTPDSTPPFTETQSGSEVTETPLPTEIPAPTATPTEGEKSAAIAAEESSDPYVSSLDDCFKVVQNEQMEGCVFLISAQEITHAVWDQLLPDTKFYALHLSNNNQTYGNVTYYRLTARQDNLQYTAETFNRLLSINNIQVTNENYELVAQAFALMTLNAEIFSYQIIFTDWKQIDMQRAFSHFDRRLRGWSEFGGQEIQWYFGFENEGTLKILGPETNSLDHEVGDYVPLPDIDESRNYGSGLPLEYHFFFDQ